ncbi:hypothetical protein [Methylomarinum vadi]|uniref:hypothetical protein n=1 Tax=Methylomarinum vadi TaxID=438855 RepID=UPI001269241D|nr:hypothetical protein [Methylomarinum vadi]
MPDYRAHPDAGFSVSGECKSQLLAVAIEERFDSFYKDKESPLAKVEDSDDAANDNEADGESADKKRRKRPSSASLV